MTVLPRQCVEHVERETRLRGLDADLVELRRRELGEERVAAGPHVDDRRVAEADMERRRARDAVRGAADDVEAVLARRLGPRLHVRLVELDDVGAGREEIEDLRAHGVRVGQPEIARRAVEVVLGLLGHGERARDRHLRPPARVRAQELQVADLDGVAPRDGPDDPRHRVGMAAAVERGARVVDVDALERGGEAVGVALPTHLAIRDDVQPGALLVRDGQARRVVVRLLQVARGRRATAHARARAAGSARAAARGRSASRAARRSRRGS